MDPQSQVPQCFLCIVGGVWVWHGLFFRFGGGGFPNPSTDRIENRGHRLAERPESPTNPVAAVLGLRAVVAERPWTWRLFWLTDVLFCWASVLILGGGGGSGRGRRMRTLKEKEEEEDAET